MDESKKHSRSDPPSVTAVVATLGRTDLLRSCLEALDGERRDLESPAGSTQATLRIVLVVQGDELDRDRDLAGAIDRLVDTRINSPNPLGFAAAYNLGLQEAIAPVEPEATDAVPDYVAVINDDAIVQPGWLRSLLSVLEQNQDVAAAQGINVQWRQEFDDHTAPGAHERQVGYEHDATHAELGAQALIDGSGIAWTTRWQAVQIGWGLPALSTDASPDRRDVALQSFPVFGASATAALYRTTMLVHVDLGGENEVRGRDTGSPTISPKRARAPIQVFDETLDTYYEDVDLAWRLRTAGFAARTVPGARCLHAPSSSAPSQRRALLVSNRHLVLARHLGRRYFVRAPSFLLRDLAEIGPPALGGWLRAARLLARFAHAGRPATTEASASIAWAPNVRRASSVEPDASADPARPSPAESDRAPGTALPTIAGVVVHWHDDDLLEQLLRSWPHHRYDLCVVDNSSSTQELQAQFPQVTWCQPEHNLGFGGGANAGFERMRAAWLLLLNSDTVVSEDALDALAEEAAREEAPWSQPAQPGDEPSNTAMIAPRLIDREGKAQQFRWQLRPLTKRRHLLAQCLFLSEPRGPALEPAHGTPVAQPAAGVLLLRRSAVAMIGGFDPAFFPAWFEDVDLAQRFADAGFVGRYARDVEIVHDGGASVPSLGFARFLQLYYRNLERYARRHGFRITALCVRPLVVLAALARIPTVWLRKPRRAISRVSAASALLSLARAAILGWEPGP